MKRILLVVLSLVFIATICQAAQVTCSGTQATVYAGSTPLLPPRTVCFQNLDTTNAVYLDTTSSLTTGTAGIILPAGAGICIDNTKTTVYGITAGSSVQVGVTLFF
jgi:hypothetical protein